MTRSKKGQLEEQKRRGRCSSYGRRDMRLDLRCLRQRHNLVDDRPKFVWNGGRAGRLDQAALQAPPFFFERRILRLMPALPIMVL